MNKYRKKPIVIEAEQWLPCGSPYFAKSPMEMPIPPAPSNLLRQVKGRWELKTLEGWYKLVPYCWIIKGVKDEYYPCDSDIFEMTYVKEKKED